MKFTAWFLFMMSVFAAVAQYNYSPGCIKAHNDISSLRFRDAQKAIEVAKLDDPANLIPYTLQAYMDFLTLFVGEDENDLDRLSDNREDIMAELQDGDQTSPWYKYSIARINLQWAFARVKFGSYFNAALDIRRAYLLLQENQEDFPDFLPNKIGLGVMHALIGSIPDNYQWISGLFAMRGSVQQGRAELLEVLEKAEEEGFSYLKDEALFFISFIDLNLQYDITRAKSLLPYFEDSSGGNLLLLHPKARILMQNGRNDEAILLLASRPRGNGYYPFLYLDYLEGLCRLNRLDTNASACFLAYTTNFKGQSYVKSAYQRLAWCALLKGDTSDYFMEMGKVLQYGNDIIDGDGLAMEAAQAGSTLPNLCLLKSRLLFDGGYFLRADSILDEKACHLTSDRDKIEYPYRKGRIHHALGNTGKALEWYAEAIEKGSEAPYYFAANAALQSAFIYESVGKTEQAAESYKACISMPNKEYKTSLNQKAKAGLNRIKEIAEK
ncbi:MAG TPA: hypothetical protein VK994_02480 [Bacteroidales bacterium]|nr:hypothetical protein [Bacteroidales bacterium]